MKIWILATLLGISSISLSQEIADYTLVRSSELIKGERLYEIITNDSIILLYKKNHLNYTCTDDSESKITIYRDSIKVAECHEPLFAVHYGIDKYFSTVTKERIKVTGKSHLIKMTDSLKKDEKHYFITPLDCFSEECEYLTVYNNYTWENPLVFEYVNDFNSLLKLDGYTELFVKFHGKNTQKEVLTELLQTKCELPEKVAITYYSPYGGSDFIQIRLPKKIEKEEKMTMFYRIIIPSNESDFSSEFYFSLNSLSFIDSVLGVTYKKLQYKVEIFTPNIQELGLLESYFKDTLSVPMSSFDFLELWNGERHLTLDTPSVFLNEYLKSKIMFVDRLEADEAYSYHLRHFNNVFCRFYKNGKLFEESLWQEGKLFGPYKRYYRNGNLKMTGNIEWSYSKTDEVDLYMSGMWYYFNETGDLIKKKRKRKRVKSNFWK